MGVYEIAFHLRKSVLEIQSLPYDELVGWYEYFRRRPVGWRDDNRAAMIVQAAAQSDKLRPEELFPSLKIIREANSKTLEEENAGFAVKFFDRFSGLMTEQSVVTTLIKGESNVSSEVQ